MLKSFLGALQSIIRDVVGVATQMKIMICICIFILTKTEKKKTLFYPRNVSKFAFNGLLETIICESDYPRHAIVYIPTVDLGQNL